MSLSRTCQLTLQTANATAVGTTGFTWDIDIRTVLGDDLCQLHKKFNLVLCSYSYQNNSGSNNERHCGIVIRSNCFYFHTGTHVKSTDNAGNSTSIFRKVNAGIFPYMEFFVNTNGSTATSAMKTFKYGSRCSFELSALSGTISIQYQSMLTGFFGSPGSTGWPASVCFLFTIQEILQREHVPRHIPMCHRFILNTNEASSAGDGITAAGLNNWAQWDNIDFRCIIPNIDYNAKYNIITKATLRETVNNGSRVLEAYLTTGMFIHNRVTGGVTLNAKYGMLIGLSHIIISTNPGLLIYNTTWINTIQFVKSLGTIKINLVDSRADQVAIGATSAVGWGHFQYMFELYKL